MKMLQSEVNNLPALVDELNGVPSAEEVMALRTKGPLPFSDVNLAAERLRAVRNAEPKGQVVPGVYRIPTVGADGCISLTEEEAHDVEYAEMLLARHAPTAAEMAGDCYSREYSRRKQREVRMRAKVKALLDGLEGTPIERFRRLQQRRTVAGTRMLELMEPGELNTPESSSALKKIAREEVVTITAMIQLWEVEAC